MQFYAMMLDMNAEARIVPAQTASPIQTELIADSENIRLDELAALKTRRDNCTSLIEMAEITTAVDEVLSEIGGLRQAL